MSANVVSNVIRFPVEKTKKDVLFDSGTINLDHLEDYIDDLTTDIICTFVETGYDVTGDDYIQDVSLMFESIRSLTYKANQTYHPVQEIADTVFLDLVYDFLDDKQLSLDFGEEFK